MLPGDPVRWGSEGTPATSWAGQSACSGLGCRQPGHTHLPTGSSHTHTWSLFVQVNFVLFVSIIRILLQKLTSPDVGGTDPSQYK